MSTVADVASLVETFAPRHLAAEGDPIGLQAGSMRRRVTRVLLALEAGPETVAETAQKGIQMLLVHHPLFYGGVTALDEDAAKGALAAAILQRRLAVYAAHTNLDAAPGGVADCLADRAGLLPNRAVLDVTGREPFLKLAVFVPETHLERVRAALCRAGAGRWGEYSECTFRVKGTGGFRGSAEAAPFLGKPNAYEEVAEWRLEGRLLASDRAAVERALLKAHPYETPAYDFTRLEEGVPFGFGRVGMLARPVRAGALARALAKRLRAPGSQIAGEGKKRVSCLAVWSGKGAPVERAVQAGAECLVTGECGHHDIESARFFGLPVIRLGHGPSERVVLAPLAKRLRKALPSVEFFVSRERGGEFVNV
ncbi:MAG: Nif3-like dinuclear metal center hexameric protein [Planctomycetota bacterium]